MAIDNVPAVQSIIEQTNLLERAFQNPLDARLAYSRLADQEVFPNGIGETFTKTRPGLFPLAQSMTALNPASNTGMDNGLTDNYYTFEQYQIAISEYANSTSVNIMQDRTLIERVFMRNVVALGEHAGRTLDGLCAVQVHTNYSAGNTYATAQVTGGTTVHVDNIVGFDTAFSATNSPGLPSPTSSSNPISGYVYDAVTGVKKGTILVDTVTADGTNTSIQQSGGVAYGKSGNLNLHAGAGFTINQGDAIVAVDGAFVVRGGGKVSDMQVTPSDKLTLQTIAKAVAQLRARNVPTLPSGNYACIIDPTLWPQLLSDQAFNYATMGQMGEGYFAKGLVNRTLGVEFIDSNLVPAFSNTAGISGGNLRHAVVGGMGLLVQGTFQGSIDAARQANAMQNGDIRLIDGKISMITRGPLDRLQEFVTQSWRWVGGFVSPTDKTSTPLIIPTTDNARYKRAVIIRVGSDV